MQSTVKKILGTLAFLIGLFFLTNLFYKDRLEQVHVSPAVATGQQPSNTVEAGTSTPQTITSTTTSAAAPTRPLLGPTTHDLMSTMHLTFEDNFDSLDFYTDGKGNIACQEGGVGRWQTVYHFCSRTIFANKEAQLYTDKIFFDYLARQGSTTTTPLPFSTENGILSIEARPIDPIVQKAVGPWAKYTSGLLTTQFSFSQIYGYFEMRAKLPKGKGVWPAFWLLPTDRTWPPEIDVMEAFGGSNRFHEGGPTEIHYATHAVKKDESCGAWMDFATDVTDTFHTYGVLWEATGVTYYFDGTPYAHCAITGDFHKPFYMLLNVAVGGEDSWPGAPDTTTVWPARMEVDYVRAFQTN